MSLDGYIAGPNGESDFPLLPAPSNKAGLQLTGHRIYPTGIVALEYSIEAAA
jgi:hypothetical protein